jgi:hypothetical protein
MQQSNSGRRLCNILEKAVKEGDKEAPIYTVIGLALGVEDVSNKYFLTDFFVLMADVERVVTLLKKVPNRDKYIDAIREIQSIFCTYSLPGDKWLNVSSLIENRNLILLLDACATFISQENLEVSLSDNQLKEYLSKCEELLKEIIESDLSDDIKTFLVVRLEEICIAIRHYSIGGPGRLRTVVEANIGGMIVRGTAISSEDKEKPILKKIFEWLLIFGSVLGLASDTQGFLLPNVTEAARFLLPHTE